MESTSGSAIQMTFSGASEAHLLAKEIGVAGVGVIVSPARPFPSTWEMRRMYVLLHCGFLTLIYLDSLPGPPLTQNSAISTLLANNVTVGVGVDGAWAARNTRFDVSWVSVSIGASL